ncbi:MAG: hypothetical protein ACXWZE_11960 [Candidatus Binatia bacterium]
MPYHAGDRPGKEDPQGALGDDQALSQRTFRQVAEQGAHERRDRVIEFFENIANHAEQ